MEKLLLCLIAAGLLYATSRSTNLDDTVPYSFLLFEGDELSWGVMHDAMEVVFQHP